MDRVPAPIKPTAAVENDLEPSVVTAATLELQRRHLIEEWARSCRNKLDARFEEDMEALSRLVHDITASAVSSDPVRPEGPHPIVQSGAAVLLGNTRMLKKQAGVLVPEAESVHDAPAPIDAMSALPHADHKLARMHSSLSAPASFICFSGPERKREVLQRSEYRQSRMGPLDVQYHNFKSLSTWTKAEDSIRIVGADAPLPNDNSDDNDAMVIQEYNGKLRHFLVFPSSHKKLTWDFFGALLILHDLLSITLQVFNPPETSFSVVMQWVTLTYWTVNMLVSVLVGYVEKGIFVMVPKKILLNYVKTWFAVDLVVVGSDWAFTIGSLAYGVSSNAGEDSIKIIRSIRLFRMVRLVRILRLRKTMESLSDLVDSEYISIIVSIAKMLTLLLLVNHVIACVWFWIGNSEDSSGWVYEHGFDSDTVHWHYQYATSLHWSVTQFTPSSMSVQPQNMMERTFAIGIVFFALVGFSYVVGSISGSLAQLRGMTENRSRQFWELRRHMRKNHVSITLSTRIQKYVEHILDSEHENIPTKNIKLLSLLSEQLRSELECEIRMPHFAVHPLFDHLCVVSRVTIHRLANNAIQNKLLARNDTLFIPGEGATHMYIVVAGRLVYSRVDSQGEERKELVDKGEDWIAEPVLWTSAWIHLGLLTALKESDLMVLDPHMFGRIVKLNPDAFLLAVTYANNFLNWINAVERDSLSDVWQGENVGEQVTGFMELDESHSRSSKGFAVQLMKTLRPSQ
eukprot:TRINITY_DN36307_c0_g1_i1.p1 TRINITY_DN36307_c0_g1~~TRINITY_DN36307_c0_g1_i1.p1  ORF type:complete len:741 (-),score=129.71 TRINITY_DN36307_c0_g1_i1:82-2304(-)